MPAIGRRVRHTPIQKVYTEPSAPPEPPRRFDEYFDMVSRLRTRLTKVVGPNEIVTNRLRMAVSVALASDLTSADIVSTGVTARQLMEHRVGFESLAVVRPSCEELCEFLRVQPHGLLGALRELEAGPIHAVIFPDVMQMLVDHLGTGGAGDELRDMLLQTGSDAIVLATENVCSTLRITATDMLNACEQDPSSAIDVLAQLMVQWTLRNEERARSSDPLGRIPLQHPITGIDLGTLVRTNVKLRDLERIGVEAKWLYDTDGCSPKWLAAMGHGFQ